MFFATKAMQSIIDLLPGYVNRNFDRTTIESPVAGTVLKRHVWNVKVMTAGAPLLDIGNMKELEITTEEAVHIHLEIPSSQFPKQILSITARYRLYSFL